MCTFSPAPSEIDDVLAVLADPSRSLAEIASAFRTTVQALKEWLSTPGIAAQLQSVEDFCMQRTRLLIALALPTVVRAVTRIVDDFNSEHQPQVEQLRTSERAQDPQQVGDPKSATTRRASRQAVLNAARLLLQLSSLTRDTRDPKAARARTNTTPQTQAAAMHPHRAAANCPPRQT